MENENKRYTFGGFTFGSQKLFNLTINIRNHAGYGTSHTVEMGFELTTEERMELIKLLINADEKDNA
jgi:hypothetical protein